MELGDKWMDAARRWEDRNDKDRIVAAAKELGAFLKSPAGEIAVHQLLRVANCQIIFGQTKELHPRSYVRVFALTGGFGGGLHMADDESTGGIVSKDYVNISPITPEVAVEVAVKYRNLEPEKVMPWLFEELDKIADSIP